MNLRIFVALPVLAGAILLPPRDANAAFRVISASECDTERSGQNPGGNLSQGSWNNTAVGYQRFDCPLPWDDTFAPWKITDAVVFVRDGSPYSQIWARACMLDTSGLSLKCGPSSGSGAGFTGPAVLTPGAPPLGPGHGWASYFIEVLAEASSIDYANTGHQLITYQVNSVP